MIFFRVKVFQAVQTKSGTLLPSFPAQPTSKNRGWLMDPLGENPWWTLLVAALPALLCTILIFMDQQITAVIINRKEHKLKVGARGFIVGNFAGRLIRKWRCTEHIKS